MKRKLITPLYIRAVWMLSHGNVSIIRGTVVFKRISDFNGPYMNKNRIIKKIIVYKTLIKISTSKNSVKNKG